MPRPFFELLMCCSSVKDDMHGAVKGCALNPGQAPGLPARLPKDPQTHGSRKRAPPGTCTDDHAGHPQTDVWDRTRAHRQTSDLAKCQAAVASGAVMGGGNALVSS